MSTLFSSHLSLKKRGKMRSLFPSTCEKFPVYIMVDSAFLLTSGSYQFATVAVVASSFSTYFYAGVVLWLRSLFYRSRHFLSHNNANVAAAGKELQKKEEKE